MAQHKLRSRIAQFKQPFLVGAVTSAALLSACGGETSSSGINPDGLSGRGGNDAGPGEDGGTEPQVTSNPPLVVDQTSGSGTPGEGSGTEPQGTFNPPIVLDECPTTAPEPGAYCDHYEPDLDCEYGADSSCPRNFTCVDGAWADHSPSCNPPPPQVTDECPSEVPAVGAACDQFAPGLYCEYEDELYCLDARECDDGAWKDESPSCNPPEFLSDCPEQRPTVGESCEMYTSGLECDYEVDQASSCPEASVLSCGSSGLWEGPEVICNPPPPEPLTECPTEVPAAGDNCEAFEPGLWCGEASCDGGVGAQCASNGLWQAIIIACNPPDWGPEPEPEDAGVDSGEPSGD